ncbi:MAG TPA: TonB-dependent receptor [Cyclobacteriaceae bacterium]|nr:TonB-dependent receptor [Cyclobacteriaceae bacterium]
MKKILPLLIILLSIGVAFGQGSISGTITDAKTKEAIIGANVVIQGTTTGSQTDAEGKFLITNVKAGTYNLQISFVTYKTHLVPDVIVEDGKRIAIDVPMSEEVSELAEVVVSGSRQTNTDYDLLRSIKDSKVVVVGITEEQISRTLDRDAAQVIKRVPGITIKDDQFIISRGLAERYNPVMLHNTYAPSVETDVRSFSFATIPSSQLDRILVFKSPAADLPGDFAGSVVKIFTKSIPEEKGWVIDYSTQVRATTTFKDFYYQERNPGFFTGYNTGFYNLPGNFPADANKVQGNDLINAGQSLKNLWKANKGTAAPDQRLTVTYNGKFNLGTTQVGTINALSYSNSYSTFNIRRGDFTGNNPNYVYDDQQYNQQIRTGLLSNWAFKINSAHLIEFKNLFNVSSNDQVVRRYGVDSVDSQGVFLKSPSGGQMNGSFDKIYRGIYSGQVMGKHDLFNKQTTVEWVAGYNNTYRDQPDYKRYITNSGEMSINSTVTPTALGRFYSKLNENSNSGGLSIKQILPISKNLFHSAELKAGLFFENKERTFSARNIGYTIAPLFYTVLPTNPLPSLPIDQLMQPQNINNTTGIQIGEATNPRDSYSAKNNLLAYYLMASVPLGGKFKLDAGIRVEDNRENIKTRDNFAAKPNIDTTFHVMRALPSANFSYNFNEKMLLRAAYGQTLNRPEFRELAPFQFYDFNFNFIYFGQPSLRTAKIQNLDLRWEFYPSKGEMITVGGYYKDFTDPIEGYIDVNSPGGGVKNVFYANSKSAQVYGAEVEVRKSLNGLTGSGFINKLSMMINSTVGTSLAHINDAYAYDRARTRPLQGQSPYIVNAALYYNSEASGWQVSLLYNVVGKTLYFVGFNEYPDVYMLPRNVLDFTFTKRLSEKISLKGGVTDLLNQPIRYYNSATPGGPSNQIIQSYKPGQVFSLGLTARL